MLGAHSLAAAESDLSASAAGWPAATGCFASTCPASRCRAGPDKPTRPRPPTGPVMTPRPTPKCLT